MQHLHLLVSNSSALRNSKNISPEALVLLISKNRGVLSRECKTSSRKFLHAVMASGSLALSASRFDDASTSVLWLPIDLFLEDTMDGSKVAATSAADTLTGKYCSQWSKFNIEYTLLCFAKLELLCRSGEGSAGS